MMGQRPGELCSFIEGRGTASEWVIAMFLSTVRSAGTGIAWAPVIERITIRILGWRRRGRKCSQARK